MSVAALAPTGPPPIRVMVVDDAVVVRGLVSRWIGEEPGLELVASLRNGREAVDHLLRYDPDVVVLDIEMPELDGLTALPLLLAKKRDLVVIMASTLTRRNAEVSMKALSLGASDYIPKPETNREVTTSTSFKRDLIEKIRQLGGRRRRAPVLRAVPGGATGVTRGEEKIAPSAAVQPSAALKLRPQSPGIPKVLLIGSSTGGPQALTALMGSLSGLAKRIPILITQHMPPTFTTILAEHIARASGSEAHEAVDGEPVVPGKIYVAPGGKHMRVHRLNNAPAIALDEGPLINFCRPAVDPLFESAVQAWGSAILAVVLTGMGSDGALGAVVVAGAGGNVIAQDEATSVVWGMPGATAQAGACCAVLPLNQIAPKIVRVFAGDRA